MTVDYNILCVDYGLLCQHVSTQFKVIHTVEHNGIHIWNFRHLFANNKFAKNVESVSKF